MSIHIFGAGGFGREVLCLIRDADAFWQTDSAPAFVVDDAHYTSERIADVPVIRRSDWRPGLGPVVVAIGDPAQRRRVVESLPGAKFETVIHPTAVISQYDVEIGAGSIITAHCVLTCNIRIGAHAHLNLGSTIGHDCAIGEFFTAAPGAKVSGNCSIGNAVYLGTNAGVREKISIVDDVTVGMGAAVVSDLTQPGTYVGVPARMR